MAFPLLLAVPALLVLFGKKQTAAPVQQGIVVGDYHPPATVGSVSPPVDNPLAHDIGNIAPPVIAQPSIPLPVIDSSPVDRTATLFRKTEAVYPPPVVTAAPADLAAAEDAAKAAAALATQRATTLANDQAAQAKAKQDALDAQNAAIAVRALAAQQAAAASLLAKQKAQQAAADAAAAQQAAALKAHQDALDMAAAKASLQLQQQIDFQRGQDLAAANAKNNGYDEGYQQIVDAFSPGSPLVTAKIAAAEQLATAHGTTFVPPAEYATPVAPPAVLPAAVPAPSPVISTAPAIVNPGARYQPNRAAN